MDDALLAEWTAWLAEAGLAGESELALLIGFCERAVAAGLPLVRAQVLIDTLHPVYEGRLVRWGHRSDEQALVEYGRTSELGARAGEESSSERQYSIERWRRSPFYRMLQTGDSLFRRRIPAADAHEFPVLDDFRLAGMTDYVALINRFAASGVIGEMDCVYSSWASNRPQGFDDGHIATLQRVAPLLALAIKSATLARMADTLMQTYLGRDAGQRVLGGRIMRGVADRIEAAIWFSDLRGFTRITDTMPEEVIPLLDDYADIIVSAVHDQGGDVLKLIGDGTLAIFPADDRVRACCAALAAAQAAFAGIDRLNARRASAGRPCTQMYLGLHIGQVFYGNIGSAERLDFTVIGPAVNETSRIAAMCRSAERPILTSAAFADATDHGGQLVSVGRYALRGLGRSQELFTLDPALLAGDAPPPQAG